MLEEPELGVSLEVAFSHRQELVFVAYRQVISDHEGACFWRKANSILGVLSLTVFVAVTE